MEDRQDFALDRDLQRLEWRADAPFAARRIAALKPLTHGDLVRLNRELAVGDLDARIARRHGTDEDPEGRFS